MKSFERIMKNQHGVALLVVVITMVVIVIISGAIITVAATDANLSRADRYISEAYYLARSAVELVAGEIIKELEEIQNLSSIPGIPESEIADIMNDFDKYLVPLDPALPPYFHTVSMQGNDEAEATDITVEVRREEDIGSSTASSEAYRIILSAKATVEGFSSSAELVIGSKVTFASVIGDITETLISGNTGFSGASGASGFSGAADKSICGTRITEFNTTGKGRSLGIAKYLEDKVMPVNDKIDVENFKKNYGDMIRIAGGVDPGDRDAHWGWVWLNDYNIENAGKIRRVPWSKVKWENVKFSDNIDGDMVWKGEEHQITVLDDIKDNTNLYIAASHAFIVYINDEPVFYSDNIDETTYTIEGTGDNGEVQQLAELKLYHFNADDFRALDFLPGPNTIRIDVKHQKSDMGWRPIVNNKFAGLLFALEVQSSPEDGIPSTMPVYTYNGKWWRTPNS